MVTSRSGVSEKVNQEVLLYRSYDLSFLFWQNLGCYIYVEAMNDYMSVYSSRLTGPRLQCCMQTHPCMRLL